MKITHALLWSSIISLSHIHINALLLTDIGSAVVDGELAEVSRLIKNNPTSSHSAMELEKEDKTIYKSIHMPLLIEYINNYVLSNSDQRFINFDKILDDAKAKGNHSDYIKGVEQEMAIAKNDFEDLLNLLLQNNINVNDSFQFELSKTAPLGTSIKRFKEWRRKDYMTKKEWVKGDTALHVAVRYNLPHCVQILLDHGADQSIENAEHMTPFAIAVENKNQKIKDILNHSKKGSGLAKVKGKVNVVFSHK